MCEVSGHRLQIILTGSGERESRAGSDLKQGAETGDYGPTESGTFEIGNLRDLIRAVPKPVIAAVNGLAIYGSHVLHASCDLTIAADTAQFRHTGSRVSSFDAGFGSAYRARVVSDKRAREIARHVRDVAAAAERWGLVNWVFPADRLLEEAKAIAAEVGDRVRPLCGSSSSPPVPTPTTEPA